jgi:hypothetical protein
MAGLRPGHDEWKELERIELSAQVSRSRTTLSAASFGLKTGCFDLIRLGFSK